MANPSDESSQGDVEEEETQPVPTPLRLNLLRWDSEWLKRRLSAVQDRLDRAVEELEKPED